MAGDDRRRGQSAVELLTVLAIAAFVAVATLPLGSAWRAARVVAGARDVATSCAAMRWHAIGRVEQHGLWFERDASGWFWWHVRDGNGNGLRTAELRNGTDIRLAGPFRLQSRVEGVRVGLPSGAVPRIPPASGLLGRPHDPVRFGSADIISFSPTGRTSSGTVYVTDGRVAVAGVRFLGATGRSRVWWMRLDDGRWRR